QRAELRLTRTASIVAHSGASDVERARFMQAEGFYRYRFESTHGVLSYVASGAAAIIDLPALQSLAGSLDLVELRLGSYDGAVHLWELLLADVPETRLRTLALYRLGWAYRSTGAAS